MMGRNAFIGSTPLAPAYHPFAATTTVLQAYRPGYLSLGQTYVNLQAGHAPSGYSPNE